MAINNYHSSVGTQVVGSQVVNGPSTVHFGVARADLATLIEQYVGKVNTLSLQQQAELKNLAQLQAAVCSQRPDKQRIKSLLSAVSGISATANIANTLREWLTGLA